MRMRLLWAVCLFALAGHAGAEPFRTSVAGVLDLYANAPEGSSVWISPGDSVLLRLGDTRFFRGVEVRLSAPMTWFEHQGSLALTAYADLDRVPGPGIAELSGRRIASELLPGRIQTIYQIPVRGAHGLRTSPYSTVPSDITPPSSFPVLFRLVPTVQVMGQELAGMSSCSAQGRYSATRAR